MKARKLLTLAMLTLVGFAGGCNTVKGLGKDIQSGAEATEKAIDNARKD